MKREILRVAVLAVAASVLVIWLADAAAAAEDTFAGRVLVLTKQPPTYFKRKDDFVAFLRKHSTNQVNENQNRTWEFEIMAFFRRPIGDYEVDVVFYDTKNGKSKSQRRFVNSYTQYTQDRNTRSLGTRVKLIRPDFDADKHYQVVIQSRGTDVATGEFTTRGTSQAAIDEQKHMEAVQAEMEVKMKELERKVKEQEEKENKENNKAAQDLF